MNYLAHLLLAGEDPEIRLGGLLGDFTRGRLQGFENKYSPAVMRGVRLHREIDRYTDAHPVVRLSKDRFSRGRRRYAGIIVDVLHDHLLSRYWHRFSESDRQEFISDSYGILQRNASILPARMGWVASRMIEQDWLGSYHDIQNIGTVYDRMSRRLRQPNNLEGALEEVLVNYGALDGDFQCFFPELRAHAGRCRLIMGRADNNVALSMNLSGFS